MGDRVLRSSKVSGSASKSHSKSSTSKASVSKPSETKPSGTKPSGTKPAEKKSSSTSDPISGTEKSSTFPLSAAIYDMGPFYKHWALFLDTPQRDKAHPPHIVHAVGTSGSYHFEKFTTDPRKSEKIDKIMPLCRVPTSQFDAIDEAAENLLINNDAHGWNCQDYVMELLDDLEAKSIIDDKDAEYGKNKDELKQMMEGFD